MMKHEMVLKVLLRLVGVVMMAAVVPAFMPFAWMDAMHRAAGLGELPDMPIIGYLTRSLSAMYALYGAALFYASLDVRRYADLLRFFGVVGIVFGLFMVGLDLSLGLPASWTACEGPFIIAFGVAVLYLAGKVRRGTD